jgi:hypothetical protein
MTKPVTGWHCRSCRFHGAEDKRISWKAMRKAEKKCLKNGVEPPKTISSGYGGFGIDYDAKGYDNYTVYE